MDLGLPNFDFVFFQDFFNTFGRPALLKMESYFQSVALSVSLFLYFLIFLFFVMVSRGRCKSLLEPFIGVLYITYLTTRLYPRNFLWMSAIHPLSWMHVA